MAYAAGEVVVLPFPYTDLSSSKQRPALVVSPAWYNDEGPDALFAYVTSVEQPEDDPFSIPLTEEGLADGRLVKPSWIRTDKLFTLEQTLVRKPVAQLDEPTLALVRRLVASLVDGEQPER